MCEELQLETQVSVNKTCDRSLMCTWSEHTFSRPMSYQKRAMKTERMEEIKVKRGHGWAKTNLKLTLNLIWYFVVVHLPEHKDTRKHINCALSDMCATIVASFSLSHILKYYLNTSTQVL